MIKDELRIYMKRLGLAFRETEAKAVVSGLPLYISAAYDWVRAELDGRRMLLAVAKQRDVDPAEVVSMWAVMRKALGGSVVLVLPPEGEDYCLALVKGGMNFIMPGARMRLQGGKEIVTKRNTGCSAGTDEHCGPADCPVVSFEGTGWADSLCRTDRWSWPLEESGVDGGDGIGTAESCSDRPSVEIAWVGF